MRFLADESCDAAVVRALRAASYDVRAVVEAAPGSTDNAVLEIALLEHRVLITEDKDFGSLVFAAGAKTLGVILIRWPSAARSSMARAVIDHIATRTADVTASFTIIEPSGARIAPLPS